MKKFIELPYLGFGIGLRPKHFKDFLDHSPAIDWLEIISENFMFDGSRALYFLDQIRERYRVVPHGVSLSIGSSDDLDWDYLERLKNLVARVNPPWFSDHLCWSQHKGAHMHNLLPLPYTPKVADYVAGRIRMVQDFIGKPFIIENVSSYVEFTGSTMPEWEFLTRVAEKADCGILLDVNNVFVSASNHHFDAHTYFNAVPPERVIQYHVAGHRDKGTFLFDSHDQTIRDEVWSLYRDVIPRFGEVSLLIERDDHIPPLADLVDELNIARQIYENIVSPAISHT